MNEVTMKIDRIAREYCRVRGWPIIGIVRIDREIFRRRFVFMTNVSCVGMNIRLVIGQDGEVVQASFSPR
jgi:hypothetical protein